MVTRHGWFVIPGRQTGIRTFESQVRGLDSIDFRNKTVLDVGCAEGLISQYALEQGACQVRGFDAVESHVFIARGLCDPTRSLFWVLDAAFMPYKHVLLPGALHRYDVSLLLSVVHKLKDPVRLLDFVANLTTDLLVIRLPARILADQRSAPLVLDVPAYLSGRFDLIAEPETSTEPVSGRPEWLGIFKRKG